jgi:UDP-N-acetylmuramyl pentapeptide phosphotransferase/UDP-N-acetylglucosamine-1-phosphate transferase
VQSLILSFFVSVLLTGWVVHHLGRGDSRALDHDVSGPQKFHDRAVPRVGGVGIFAGMVAGAALLTLLSHSPELLAFMLLVCALPAFGAGLIEDFTKRVSPAQRLLATLVSAALAFWLLDAQIHRSDIPGLDALLSLGAGAFIVTLLAVAGIANSVNIIDGFNGLASMCVMIMLGAIAYVAFQVNDPMVGALALVGIGAVLGFFVWNFPSGLIFLGDGGAYFLGFYVAEMAILLLVRNPDVSPLFPLLVCIYPVFETVFSIYRRRFLRAVPPSMPDGIHLHSLIYRRVLRWAVGDRSAKALIRRNSMTSPFLWALCMVSVVPAVLFWDNSVVMAASLALFALSYVALYWSIVRFRSPRWLRRLATRPTPLQHGDNQHT